MLQVLLIFPLWDQWKPVLLLCSTLDISEELTISETGSRLRALNDYRGQPPTAVTNRVLHQRIQNYTVQSSSQFKPRGGKEENCPLVNFTAFLCLFYIFTTQGLLLSEQLTLWRQDISKVSEVENKCCLQT